MDADSRSQVINLKDYKPYPYKLHETHLEFFLDPETTKVIAHLHFDGEGYADLELDGEELRLISVAINDKELTFGDISHEDGRLTISHDAIPTGAFVLRTEVEISPQANTALSGLYISNDMYCTQCEAQGFRRITYFPDRPDVMSEFYVKIHAESPVRLSNGNMVAKKKNYSEWHDPWPKPSYLFALVAGELVSVDDKFTTASGRDVDLKIYVRPGDEGCCDYAMDALKRSMRWDEEAYGREYDLDLFMIVAVDDFNMGAMENKGLNIFNSRLVLASPETATDAHYEAIEAVIAHEYFHNWTGDRVTCRDWFQLSLKEGLTVYRDQKFSAHERSEGVQRIKDVKELRARQFPEDAGPLAHPVRPTSYQAIDNFYTSTVYEKGAEVIGMIHTLVGAKDYRKATDLYFERHDGQACTIEDWLQVFIDTTGRDLDQFKLWYSQAGTPRVSVATQSSDNKLDISLSQSLRDQQDGSKAKPMLIPLRYTVYDRRGDLLEHGIYELTESEASFEVSAPKGAVLSINQGFSAPINMDYPQMDAPFLLRHDKYPYNRWEAAQSLALDVLARGKSKTPYVNAIGALIADEELEPDYRALLLSLPDQSDIMAELATRGEVADPIKISKSCNALMKSIAKKHQAQLEAVYKAMRKADKGTTQPEDAGRRALALKALSLLSLLDKECVLAKAHYKKAQLITDYNGALAILVREGQAEEALANYYKKFKNERLVVDYWIGIQAANTPAKKALKKVQEIAEMDLFENANPNRFRALYGNFAMGNTESFHAASGKGYDFIAEVIIDYDSRNPQTAARLVTAYQSYRYFDTSRQELVKSALSKILQAGSLSKNTREMVTRLLD